MNKHKYNLYQIYENKPKNKIGKFICMIDAKSAKEALMKYKKIGKKKAVAVTDYGIRFFIPLTRGVFYYE
jgi:DNA uptake protein ComE-like DNA-binding protein